MNRPARVHDGLAAPRPDYVNGARLGDHGWWRYVGGLLIMLFFWLIVGTAVSLLITFAISGGLDPSALDPVSGFVVTMAGFPIFMAGIALVVTRVHHRPFRSLITARDRIDWRRVGLGFLVWFVLWSLVRVVQFLLDPAAFSVTADLLAVAVFAPLAIVLTAVQTTTEELFYRGYAVQAASLIWGNRIFLALVSAVLFTLPHLLNPETAAGGLVTVFFGYFLATGVVWIVVSLIDGSTELAIGAHFANNIASILLVGTAGTVISTPALFTVATFDPVLSAVSSVVIAAMFAVTVLGLLRRATASGRLDRGRIDR